MATIEQEINERVSKLDEDKQRQVLEFVRRLDEDQEFSFEDWLRKVRAVRAEMRSRHGKDFRISVQDLLDEVREERLNDIMSRL